MTQAITPMDTPQMIFCQMAGSSSWRAPLVHRAAMVVDMVSAVVEKAAIRARMITGMIIMPRGTFLRNSHRPVVAPPA